MDTTNDRMKRVAGGLEEDWREVAGRVRLMRRAPVLRGLSRDLLNELAARMRPVEVAAGEVLYRQDDPAEGFYVIESGRLAGRVEGSEEVWYFEAGQSVGDAALLGAPSYLATITAEAHTRMWSLSSAELEELRRGDTALDAALAAAKPGPEGRVKVLPIEREQGFRIDVSGVSRSVRGGKRILHDVSFSVEPGELVAIVGGSGAGKSTLLDAMAAVHPADEGTVLYNGVDLYRNIAAFRSMLGYVPQEDIIHRELPLELTLRYAARLRLPAVATRELIDATVAETMEALDLTERAELRVGSLSGGQRKRASIGVELLTRPRVFFLDEPTSGLDPATESEMMRLLRRLADSGSAVVLTTHVPENIGICDKVVFLARDGRLVFVGRPEEATEYFVVDSFAEIYERLAEEATPQEWERRFEASRTGEAHRDAPPSHVSGTGGASAPPPIGAMRQWAILTRRNVDILIRNRLTLAILVGSPVLVVLMFAVLFKPGAFDYAHPSPSATLMILYWVAFGGFFFGLTYGLLQIVTELAVFRRERLVNLGIGPYVMSKLAVLVPFLLGVDVVMLGVLRGLGRLPAAALGTYTSLGITLLLDAVAALALGLLTSAAVSDAAQATVAMPMICFPQVLFSGAILPVPIMAAVGKILSYPMSDRWAFEALGRGLNLNRLFAKGGSSLGPPLLAQYGDTFSRAVWVDWAIMGGFGAVFLALACMVLARRARVAVS